MVNKKENTKEGRSKQKFKKSIQKEVTHMFETILDYTQVACSADNTFKVLRSKILRAGNECIRNLSGILDEYTLDYCGGSEDVIEVIRKRG